MTFPPLSSLGHVRHCFLALLQQKLSCGEFTYSCPGCFAYKLPSEYCGLVMLDWLGASAISPSLPSREMIWEQLQAKSSFVSMLCLGTELWPPWRGFGVGVSGFTQALRTVLPIWTGARILERCCSFSIWVAHFRSSSVCKFTCFQVNHQALRKIRQHIIDWILVICSNMFSVEHGASDFSFITNYSFFKKMQPGLLHTKSSMCRRRNFPSY